MSTEAAVQAFQQDFGVLGSTLGTYDAATEARLADVIDQEQIGNIASWDENTQAATQLMGVANSAHLAGIRVWRLGYQATSFWSALAQSGE